MKQILLGVFLILPTLLFFACEKENPCVEVGTTFTAPCPTDTIWVCGCNGTTYLNSCWSSKVGITDITLGPCQ